MKTPEFVNDLQAEDQTESRKAVIRWYPYLLVNGNLKDKMPKGSLEFSDYPAKEDVEMAIHENNKSFPAGKYKIEKKVAGVTRDFFYMDKPESAFFQQSIQKPIVQAEQDFEDESEFVEPEFDISGEIETRAQIIALQREIEEMKRQEQERQEAAQTSQNDTLLMMREMQKQSEKSFQQGLQMAQTIIQSAQPQSDPTKMMLEMLQGTLAVQKGVRELSEEIAPQETTSTGTYLGEAANLVSALGQNVGKILPLFLNRSAAPTPTAQRVSKPQPINGNGQGEITDLLDKVKSKKEGSKK